MSFEKNQARLRAATKNEQLPKQQTTETPNKPKEVGAVSLKKIQQTLQQRGFSLVDEREPLSSGFNGPIYKMHIQEEASNTQTPIIEKTFVRGGTKGHSETGKRFQVFKQVDRGDQQEIRHRLGVVDKDSGEIRDVVVDWIYNEEMALKTLEGIPGIPKTYGAVYDGLKGSILEQYIDGYDLWFIADNTKNIEQISAVFDKVLFAYDAAAEQGLIYNQPSGSTIMVESKTNQPYLIDWYNHSTGDPKADGPVKEKYLAGRQEIIDLKTTMIKEYDSRQAAVLKNQIQAGL